jgi:NAD+ diphosphatase
MKFEPDYKYFENITDDSYCFFFADDNLLANTSDSSIAIPRYSNIRDGNLEPFNIQYFGIIEGIPCFTGEIKRKHPDPGYSLTTLRSMFMNAQEKWFYISGRAYHLMNWSRNNVFCGKCGGPLTFEKDERAKKCTSCGNIIYPKISPAAIVAVIRDGKILLARSRRFTHNLYSVLAGFVEPGESIEECAVREIFEETGITVKNLRYFGSQPWPFPDSLMVGFTAEYESGDIVLDDRELVDAGWFSPDEMPNIPPSSISIARELIDWYLENYRRGSSNKNN